MNITASLDTPAPSCFRLRLLQTTDLHMHLLAFDYSTMQHSENLGLANLVSQIDALRSDDIPTLLFDTGDFLQGTPLADFAMQTDTHDLHPAAFTFNKLSYDAIALGNHDFDYGIDKLKKVIEQIDCPVLSANVTLCDKDAPYAATTLISVPLSNNKTTAEIKVGVIGLTTPALSLMDQGGSNTLTTTAPVIIAKVAVNELRQQGADIIVALCHFGIDPDDHIENVAADVAGLEGIDVVMAGHTHETFPTGTSRQGKAIDLAAGTIHDTPTVMAGAFGRQLGVVELCISGDQGKVEVLGHHVELRVPLPQNHAGSAPFDEILPLHTQTVAHMNAQVAESTLPLSTEFSLIQPDLTQFLLSGSRQSHIKAMIQGTADTNFPILSTAAPFQTGSQTNPDNFIVLPPGPIKRRDVSAIYPFHNAAVALRRNGSQIKNWLEDSALIFRRITPGTTIQNLIDPKVPSYRFDTIFGLTYSIDVSAEPGHKISNLRINGNAISDTDKFVLVTSTNRLSHGQNIPPTDIICLTEQSSQDILVQSMQRQSPVSTPCPDVWDFKAIPNTKAQFTSSPNANPAMSDRQLSDDGLTPDGFRQFTIDFDG